MTRLFFAVFFLSVVACSPVPPPGNTGGGSAGGLTVTGGGTSGAGGGMVQGGGQAGGASQGSWTAAGCDAVMDKFAAVNCADRQNWLGLKVSACAKLSNTNSVALCGAAFTRAKACESQFLSQAMLACIIGLGTDTNDTCGPDVVLGALCAATVNNGQCAGVQCRFNADCPTGWTCNDQTDRCVDTSANCPGLPCRFNADCTTGFTCNNATGQCNAN
jgi:hypothetical protein